MTHPPPGDAPYRDARRPVGERVDDLVGRMTLEEKVAQLVGVWVTLDTERGEVAPYQGMFAEAVGRPRDLAEQLRAGIGQITRAYGSGPVTPADGIRLVNDLQRRLVEGTRLGIPAIVHEECLTGFMALGATTFPSPLAWGATWDPALIEEVGRAIAGQMRRVGAHQGLAPVLDVVRDPRWGRVEECIAEDPHLVGAIGAAYVRGLQGDDPTTGVVATPKHFAGYSSSEGGRNLAPARLGRRELEDVFLPPFERAIREGGALSIMNAYQDIDGEPVAASRWMLTEVLRDRWGFDGIVVSDYFSVAFLWSLHGTAADTGHAAVQALLAGLDVELPNPDGYAAPLRAAVEDARLDEAVVDRSLRRILALKVRLGLFEAPYVDEPAPEDPVDLDPPAARALARRVAERSVTVLRNDGGILPLAADGDDVVAVIGPNADDARLLLGNYSFENHVHYQDGAALGLPVTTVLAGITGIVGPDRVRRAWGCDVTDPSTDGFTAAVAAADEAAVAVVVVGDRAGHFGRGTVGEGTDTDDLSLPGVQEDLVRAVVATSTPTVVVLVNGRPHGLAWVAEHAAAVVAAWMPGEEGGAAVADVLFGGVEPTGRTPVTFASGGAGGAGQQPLTYLRKALGATGYAGSSTRPVFPFGHGLAYTTFGYDDLDLGTGTVPVDAAIDVACTVTNTGHRPGREVVQVYLRDVVASITRPVQELAGFSGVELEPRQSARVRFSLPADLASFTGVDLRRIVEPGVIEVQVGASSADIRLRGEVTLTGEVREVGEGRALAGGASVERLGSGPMGGR